MKVQKAKKKKCVLEPTPLLIDDTDLLETPVKLIKDGKEWALVATPNKAPTTT